MAKNLRNAEGEDVESNTHAPFDRYIRAASTSSHRHRDESVRPKETVGTTKVTSPTNPAPLVSTVAVPRGDLVEVIHKKGAKEFEAVKRTI
ncbi:hypothetical protein GOBAR_DD11538 [Gossypium barbadense]|nr:hypothetical protein GOBAR_DD11538 [Gossypium barbadense]